MNPTITGVSVSTVTLPLRQTFVTACRSTAVAEVVRVQVTDSDGVVGNGEAPATWQVTGESLAGMVAAAEGPLAASVVGRNPDDREDTALDVELVEQPVAAQDLNGLADVTVLVGSMMEGPIGVAAASVLAGLADALAPADLRAGPVVHDLDAAWWLATDSAPAGITYAAGELRTPDCIGLGRLVDQSADPSAP